MYWLNVSNDIQLHPIGIKINKIDYKLKAIGEKVGETDTKPSNIHTKESLRGFPLSIKPIKSTCTASGACWLK